MVCSRAKLTERLLETARPAPWERPAEQLYLYSLELYLLDREKAFFFLFRPESFFINILFSRVITTHTPESLSLRPLASYYDRGMAMGRAVPGIRITQTCPASLAG